MSIILFRERVRSDRVERKERWREGTSYSVGNSIVYTNLSVRTRTNAFILIHLIQLRTREKFFPYITLLRWPSIDKIPQIENAIFGSFGWVFMRKKKKDEIFAVNPITRVINELLENTRRRLFKSKTESDRASILEVVLAAHHRKRESL